MNAMRASIGALAAVLAIGALSATPGCSGETAAEGGAGTPSGAAGGGGASGSAGAPPAERKPVDPATAGSLSGMVRVEGDVPPPATFAPSSEAFCMQASHGEMTDESLLVQAGKLQNAFVWISDGLQDYVFDAPSTPVEIDQRGCAYAPRLVGARTGQTVLLHNHDPVLHNVNAKAKINKGGNLAMPADSDPRDYVFKKVEVAVPLTCDVHPWMRAFVAVVPHPCFAITGADGAFRIEGLPPGEYTLEAWHEVLGRQPIPVSVEAGKDTRVPDIVYHK